MSVEDFIIYVYCCVEDICRTLVNQPLRSRGFMPKLSDAEVITMEIVGEFIGKDHDKGYGAIFVITGMTGFLTWGRVPTLPNKAPIYGI
jgi:hypothetical protein